MRMHDEFSGTITLTENSSRELFKVLQEQDEAFINDVLCGRCGFTLKSADGRSVELVPNTNKRCQSVESVEADTPQTESTGSPIGDYRDGVGAWHTDCEDRYAVRTDSGEVVAYACPLGCEQTDCGWK